MTVGQEKVGAITPQGFRSVESGGLAEPVRRSLLPRDSGKGGNLARGDDNSPNDKIPAVCHPQVGSVTPDPERRVEAGGAPNRVDVAGVGLRIPRECCRL